MSKVNIWCLISHLKNNRITRAQIKSMFLRLRILKARRELPSHGSNRMQMTKQMALIIEITLINRDEKCAKAISKEIFICCKKSQCPRALAIQLKNERVTPFFTTIFPLWRNPLTNKKVRMLIRKVCHMQNSWSWTLPDDHIVPKFYVFKKP